MNNVLVIEANIGTGKSTLLPKLASELSQQTGKTWNYVLEEVDDNKEFQAKLKAFTDDPKANRADFQSFMTNLRHNVGKNLPKDVNWILERSLLSDLIFSSANHNGEAEDDAHIQRVHDALDNYTHINTCVYLKADPRVSYQRMLQRGREQEAGTPLSYIETISKYHDKVLPEVCSQYAIPLLTLDYSQFMSVTHIAKQAIVSMGITPSNAQTERAAL